ETLDAIDLGSVSSHGYCFQIDLTLRTDAAGIDIVETPITFVERARGESKMSGAIVAEALWRVTLWGVRRRLSALRSIMRRPVRWE
ncbi:MAG TPA: dolichol-phosphate mannosyltransferase, partial [Nocardioidaceae bacterium]|nr:dolichol-phosphate mannosyltransferase [Nocardioidaceae bacterium]